MEDDLVKIKTHQVVHDLAGNLPADELVYHLFCLKDGKVTEFEIGEKIKM